MFHINLAGIGLGNGLIDVTQQTEPMIDYAYYHGLIDSTQRKNIVLEWERCYAPGHEEDYQEEPKPYHSFNGTYVDQQCLCFVIHGAILLYTDPIQFKQSQMNVV